MLTPVSLPGSFDTQKIAGDLATAERLFTRAMQQLQWQHEDRDAAAEHVDDGMPGLQQVSKGAENNLMSGRVQGVCRAAGHSQDDACMSKCLLCGAAACKAALQYSRISE